MKTQETPRENRGQGHRKRLREKFLAGGLSGFHDYEVIELLLSLNTPRKDCKPSAKILLKRFKTFQGVMEARMEDLCRVEGVGQVNSLGILLIKAVADRYLESRILSRDVVKNSEDLSKILKTKKNYTGKVFSGNFIPKTV